MTASFEKYQIVARSKACNCGCNGKDPWHRMVYHRVVHDINYLPDGHDQTGWIRLPMSTKPVRVTRHGRWSEKLDQIIHGGWVVDRDSIVFDKGCGPPSPNLNAADKNVLDAIVFQTCKTKGKYAGDRKKTINGEVYYSRCLNKLASMGLIEWLTESTIGTGWAATRKGFQQWKANR